MERSTDQVVRRSTSRLLGSTAGVERGEGGGGWRGGRVGGGRAWGRFSLPVVTSFTTS